MIGFLDGRVAGRTPDGCFIDVGGVGYRVVCSAATIASLPSEGERVRLFTHTHVREDALALFGFVSGSEQRLFEALISVSGVGPKVALAICSALSPDSFKQALVADDTGALASVPGIGKKTAQRIIIELKEQFDLPDLDTSGATLDARARARSALENLGYSPGEVRAALAELSIAADDNIEDVVRSALKVLA